MKLEWNDTDITGSIVSATWEGSAKQAARTVTFSVAYSPNDKGVRLFDIQNGDRIDFYPGYPEDKKTMFSGIVTSRERLSEAGELTYTAKDGMVHLLRSSGTYRFENKTPEMIVGMVCRDVQVPVGTLAATNINISKMFFQERPYYEIIMAAYTKAYRKNNKAYIAQMNGTKLEVIEKGKVIPNFHIKQGERITASSYSEDIDNMVNRVYVYDGDNKQIGSISNSDWVSKYGVFQNAISVDSGDGTAEANNELHGIDKTASLDAIGDIRCVSGLGVIIEDALTGLNGKFWIENDVHTWSDGLYTMSLELAFQNVMDIQEADEEQEETETKTSSQSETPSAESSALEEVLNEARRWLGTGESPPGSNHNAITEYYGMDAAWCCMFIWTIFDKTGHGDLFMNGGKTAYCFDVMNWYKPRGKWGSTPKMGALVIYGGEGHIGIVETVSGSSFVSIEGNYGDAVKRRNGPSGNILGFCYPDWPVGAVSAQQPSGFTGYALSEAQLRGIARLCQQEQGTVTGAKAEASLMANLFEKKGKSYGTGADGIYNYVKNSGWFARASYWMGQTGTLDRSILEGVRDVLVNGRRTLPRYVDEHDCFSDIISATNNGVAINIRDRSKYVQDVTQMRNCYGSSYTFYCFPDSSSDPFGYTSR